jgi:plasmid rolling circle replication initiator protein Rep
MSNQHEISDQKKIDMDAERERLKKRAATLIDRAEKMSMCASQLSMKVCPDEHEKHIEHAVLCHDRVCPLCSYLRSQRLSARFSLVVEKIMKQDRNKRFLMIAATIPNPPDGALEAVHKIVRQCAAKFVRHKDIKRYIVGSARSIETTRKNGTFHPHVHFLLNVTDDYFSDDNLLLRPPTGPKMWTEIWSSIVEKTDWRKYYGADWQAKNPDGTYIRKITDFSIKAIREGTEQKSALEVSAKYITKAEDIERFSTPVFLEYLEAIYRAKLWVTTGSLKVSDAEIEASLIDEMNDDPLAGDYCQTCGLKLIDKNVRWDESIGDYREIDEPIKWPWKKCDFHAHRRRQRLNFKIRGLKRTILIKGKRPIDYHSDF